ncbi:chemotaxis protein CheY [Microbacterium sp. 18062]|uniref:chemotaxis protein CheY n=1 Tax=Microbacterium sp. 18062 TaxID=2681410 RepID=UPI00135B8BD0|nr:chemotaxis protein CheY [Microbacterium sp. 18062]
MTIPERDSPALPDGHRPRVADAAPALDRILIAWERHEGSDRRSTSHRLLRALAGGPGPVRSGPCPRCGGAHGRPRVPDRAFEVSVSYTDDLAIVAAVPSSAADAIGIDAQAGEPDGIASADRLRPGTTLLDWTRIEAALKADGRGLAVDPGRVSVSAGPDGWTALVPGRAAPVLGRDVDGPDGVVVSVAIVPAATEGARADPPTA